MPGIRLAKDLGIDEYVDTEVIPGEKANGER